MKKLLVLTGSLFLLYAKAQSQTSPLQRALLIGIDKYEPPAGYTPSTQTGRSEFSDLEGCKNDIRSIHAVITTKFNFKTSSVDTLLDEAASRANILKGMNDLLEKSKPGDIALIYYSGHGSRVKNSLSFEKDKKDQTIVPSDTWKEGVPDIRDKELSAIFNKFIDKGVKLTCIMDCCHSGSLSRGPNIKTGKFRFMPESNWDAKDASHPVVPELRKEASFLMISSAQSDEFAQEQFDEQGEPHGAFTLALLEAIQQQSVNASAVNLFSAARAILKSNGQKQEPVLGGNANRQQETLFGIEKGKLADYTLVPVVKVTDNKVELQAGYAVGLYKYNELTLFNEKNDTVCKIKVDTVLGITRSLGTVVKGDASAIKPGTLLKITNWVSPRRPLLSLYIPASSLTEADVQKFAALAAELEHSGKVKWVDDIKTAKRNPYATIFWRDGKCYLKKDTAAARVLVNPTLASVTKEVPKDSSLYVEMPLSAAYAGKISGRLAENPSIKLAKTPGEAQYTLYGILGTQNRAAYGFRKVQVTVKDSLDYMPLATDCFEVPASITSTEKNIADSLFDMVLKLSKIRGWLTLQSPDITKNSFVYKIQVFNEDKQQPVTDGRYQIGDNISIKLVANQSYYTGKPKYVYVFGVDQKGTMSLYFPKDDGNVANKLPIYEDSKLVKEIVIQEAYTVPPPSGIDNFFLLASDEPIGNAGLVFNQEGVVQGGIRARGIEDKNPLVNLLDMGNADLLGTGRVGARGAPSASMPANWSLQRISIRCSYKN